MSKSGKSGKSGKLMHLTAKNGVPLACGCGTPGPGGHYFFSNIFTSEKSETRFPPVHYKDQISQAVFEISIEISSLTKSEFCYSCSIIPRIDV